MPVPELENGFLIMEALLTYPLGERPGLLYVTLNSSSSSSFFTLYFIFILSINVVGAWFD